VQLPTSGSVVDGFATRWFAERSNGTEPSLDRWQMRRRGQVETEYLVSNRILIAIVLATLWAPKLTADECEHLGQLDAMLGINAPLTALQPTVTRRGRR